MTLARKRAISLSEIGGKEKRLSSDTKGFRDENGEKKGAHID